jgi:hypothetical protein
LKDCLTFINSKKLNKSYLPADIKLSQINPNIKSKMLEKDDFVLPSPVIKGNSAQAQAQAQAQVAVINNYKVPEEENNFKIDEFDDQFDH